MSPALGACLACGSHAHQHGAPAAVRGVRVTARFTQDRTPSPLRPLAMTKMRYLKTDVFVLGSKREWSLILGGPEVGGTVPRRGRRSRDLRRNRRQSTEVPSAGRWHSAHGPRPTARAVSVTVSPAPAGGRGFLHASVSSLPNPPHRLPSGRVPAPLQSAPTAARAPASVFPPWKQTLQGFPPSVLTGGDRKGLPGVCLSPGLH